MPFVSSVRGSFGPQANRKKRTNGLVAATGGTITTAGGYRIHTFTAVGSSTFVSDGEGSVEYLIVAGGGGGGGGYQGGGGGAGGLLTGSTTLALNTSYSVVVGNYGNGSIGSSIPTQGGNSTAFGLTAFGGGYGAGEQQVSGGPGAPGASDGGSGGGVGHPSYQSVRTGVAGQGNNGGTTWGSCCSMAGGGGAGGPGGFAPSDGNASSGGVGLSVFGTFYAGGGGGANRSGGTRSSGGNGGGGAGGNNDLGTNGTDGLGGGGGGSGSTSGLSNGGRGGSGVVIIRYPL